MTTVALCEFKCEVAQNVMFSVGSKLVMEADFAPP
jgi:hypothetical protein